MESRETVDGRREVLIDTPTTREDITRDTLSMLQEQNERGILIAGKAASLAKEQADTYRVEMEVARTELKAARRGGRIAWSVVGGFLIAGGVVAWLAAQTLTRQSGEIDTRTREAADLKAGLDTSRQGLSRGSQEAERLRNELAQAKADLTAQKQLVEVLVGDRDKMRQVVDKAHQSTSDARERAARAEEKRAAIEARVAELETALAAVQKSPETRPGPQTRPAPQTHPITESPEASD